MGRVDHSRLVAGRAPGCDDRGRDEGPRRRPDDSAMPDPPTSWPSRRRWSARNGPAAAARRRAMTPRAVIVVGSVNMDLTVRARRAPGPGETVTATGFATSGGGKGANQAVAAARMGATTRLIGCV